MVTCAVRSGPGRNRGGPACPSEQCEEKGEDTEASPGGGQAVVEEQRDERSRRRDAQSDAGEDCPAGEASAPVRHVRQHGGCGEHHQGTAGYSGQQPPEEEPGEGNGGRAGEEGRGGEQHHRAKQDRCGKAGRKRAPQKRSGEIAGEIGGSEIGGDGGGKPVSADDGRQQRRVGKTCQADADQGGAGTGQGRPPLVHAALWRHHWWGRWVRTDRVGMNCLESRYRSGRLRG